MDIVRYHFFLSCPPLPLSNYFISPLPALAPQLKKEATIRPEIRRLAASWQWNYLSF
jgi:hypothetical protein